MQRETEISKTNDYTTKKKGKQNEMAWYLTHGWSIALNGLQKWGSMRGPAGLSLTDIGPARETSSGNDRTKIRTSWFAVVVSLMAVGLGREHTRHFAATIYSDFWEAGEGIRRQVA